MAPEHWPDRTRRVYGQLQTYEIVGASACVAAIVEALSALAGARSESPSVLADVEKAGQFFCALKPDTAAYRNAVEWIVHGLTGLPAAEVAETIRRRGEVFLAYRSASLDRLVAVGQERLADGASLLVHDYSSSVLLLLGHLADCGRSLRVFVTWGQPLDKGALVARLVAAGGHEVIVIPDTAIGRTMPEVDAVLSGVEALYPDGGLANTVGTYPIALVARTAGVPFYGVSECIKVDPRQCADAGELTARLLHPWARLEELQEGIHVRLEVLDYTPPALITGYITERGFLVTEEIGGALAALYAELDGLTRTA